MKKLRLFLLIVLILLQQDQVFANDPYIDSLAQQFATSKNDSLKLSILNELADNAPDGEWQAYNEQMGTLSASLLQHSEERIRKNARRFYGIYLNNLAYIYAEKADYFNAIAYYNKCFQYFTESSTMDEIALVYSSIGAIYDRMGDSTLALNSYMNAFRIQKNNAERKNFAATLNNIANIYSQQNKKKLAFNFYYWANQICERLQIIDHTSITVFNGLGSSYLYENNSVLAKYYFDKALKGSKSMKDSLGLTTTLLSLSEYYSYKSQSSLAIRSAEESYKIAKKIGSQIRIQAASLELIKLYESSNKYAEAFEMTKIEKEATLQLNKLENRKSVMRNQLQTEFELKEKRNIEKLAAQELYTRIGLIGILLLTIFSYFIFRERGKSEKARKKSDELLLNILPQEVAEELKSNGSTIARHFDEVTVLFTDFVGFTQASERMSPQELIDELHACFKKFDAIITEHGIEKIKTIGDAYMAVSGLPDKNPNHAINVVKASIEINKFMLERYEQMGNKTFEIRIGINSGSVVAGIVGVKKFAYDIWGDTVNIAAKMEQSGEAGKINISESTYQLINNFYNCSYRGEIKSKNKSNLKMYFIEELKENS